MKHSKLWFVIITIVFVFIIFIILHEETHQTIYEYYGCDAIKSFMHTQPEVGCNKTESLIHAQSMVDVIGYQIVPILMILCLMYGAIIIKEWNTMKIKKKFLYKERIIDDNDLEREYKKKKQNE